MYAYATLLAQLGVRIVSCDALTAMYALERAAPTQPLQPGRPERREVAYVQPGTVSWICTVEGATGQVIALAVGPTRTEEDFASPIAQTIVPDPAASWVFITDPLHIHQSESLVRLVAARCGLEDDLGKQGERSIPHGAGKPGRLAEQPVSPHAIPLPAETYVVAQAGGDLAGHPGAPGHQAGHLHLPGRPAGQAPGLHRRRQAHRQTVSLDLRLVDHVRSNSLWFSGRL